MSDITREDLMQVPLDQKLQSEAQWRVWIGHIKSAAVAEDVWDYLDPEKADDEVLQVPKAQEEPSIPRDNRQRERDIMELDDAELKRYTFAVQAYDRRDQRRQRLLKTMSRLNNLITRSLATEHHYLVVGEDSPRKKLIKLSETFKPKPQSRQQQLRRAWREMIRQKPQGDTNHWLTQWVSLFEEGKIAGIPDCSNGDHFAIRDFLDAIQSVDDTWCTAWRERLADQEKSVTFHEVIASYRSRRGDLAISSGRKQPKIALASLNGEPEAKPVEKTYRKKCPCGNTHPQHHFSKCFYLNESIRPEGWKPKEGTIERISENIKQMSPQDQEKIVKIQQKKAESAHLAGTAPQEGQPLVFFANDTQAIASSAMDEDLLKDSWILDSGSTVHICNDREQFLTYAPRKSTVKTENEDIDHGTFASGINLDIPQPVNAGSQVTEPQSLDTPSQEKEATSQLVETQQMMSPSPTPPVQPAQASEPRTAPRDIVGDISSRNICSLKQIPET
ncbi:hypothetical protein N7460_007284 [Penicillium canescens]|uniref:Uncharacterized protein n=1 Tax=Penicillium canescens TaxID=5083 RepID=A0AAD6IAW2_PENCN|nr:hypothetical protein N7460_007284 [Penicillium canescens]